MSYYRATAAIKLNISGVITNRGDNIDYVYTNSSHSDPLQRIVPAKLISSESYDREKYLEMILDQPRQFYRCLDLVAHYLDSIEKRPVIGGTKYINSGREIVSQQKQSYEMGEYQLSLFPEEDVLTREIETWRGFIDKLPSDEDKTILTKLLNDCYKYSVAINNHAQLHPFPIESLIMSLLLTQHKLIKHLKSTIPSKRTDTNQFI